VSVCAGWKYCSITISPLASSVLGVRQGAEHAVTVDQQLAAMTLDVATELVHCVPPFQRHRRIAVDPYL
jgi:hypothetical protein